MVDEASGRRLSDNAQRSVLTLTSNDAPERNSPMQPVCSTEQRAPVPTAYSFTGWARFVEPPGFTNR